MEPGAPRLALHVAPNRGGPPASSRCRKQAPRSSQPATLLRRVNLGAMRASTLVGAVSFAVVAAGLSGACTTKQPQTVTYFNQTIDPILQTSCVRTNTGAGCHVADDKGNALGNLDLTGYGGLARRRDLLLNYGPYLRPSLLAKNIPPFQVALQFWDGNTVDVTTDIKHTAGPILDPTAS